MSVKASSWAWDQSLSGNQKLVLLAYADFANDDGQCWPGHNRIIERTGLSRRSVIRIVQSLISSNHMSKVSDFDDSTGRQKSNRFLLNIIGEGVSLSPPIDDLDTVDNSVDNLSITRGGGCQGDTGEGVTGDTGEGVTGDTPITLNHHIEPPDRSYSVQGDDHKTWTLSDQQLNDKASDMKIQTIGKSRQELIRMIDAKLKDIA